MNPLVVREGLREPSCRSNFSPRERMTGALECGDNLRAEIFIWHHAFSRLVPIGAFAFRTNSRLVVEVARHPFVTAAFAAVAHHRDRNLSHRSNHLARNLFARMLLVNRPLTTMLLVYILLAR